MNAPTEDFVRLPPHSIESEQSVLGGLLLDSKAWDRVCDVVSDADFFRDDHRRIFRHMHRLAEAGIVIDVVTVFDRIEKSNEIDQTGGLAYLGEIANATSSSANIRRYAQIVRERSALRRLMALGDSLAARCAHAEGMTAATLVTEFEGHLAAAVDETADEPAVLVDVLRDALVYIDGRGETAGLQTGFDELDKLTGGLEPGQLVVVAARPSVGKTLWACNVADRVSARGQAVLFFTLEMSKREIGMRILAARSAVSVHAMRAGTKSDEAWDRMAGALPAAEKQRLWIDDKPAITVGYVRARARRMQRKHGLDLVVVDYLGLMKGQGDNRVQEMGSLSRGLKSLAKELGVPIIVLAQLNRAVESRAGDKRPLSSDLRDSGEIEQDADIVVMLHRESLYSDAPQWDGFAEFIVRKNRNGPLGDVPMRYDGRLMAFAPWLGDNPRHASAAKHYAESKGFRE